MKIAHIIAFTVISVFLQPILCFSDAAQIDALYNDINSKWNARNYADILSVINSRLQANSSDVLALAIKQYYYIFADNNVDEAHQAASALHAITDVSSNEKLKSLGKVMTDRVLNIPTSQSVPYTQVQRDKIHGIMNKFPYIDEAFVLWGMSSGSL